MKTVFEIQAIEVIQGITNSGVPHKATKKKMYVSKIDRHIWLHKKRDMAQLFVSREECEAVISRYKEQYPGGSDTVWSILESVA